MLRKYLPAVFGLAFSIMLNTGAQAQFGVPDVYVAAGAGGAVLKDTVVTEETTGTTFETLPFPGYALTGAVGLDFGLLRLEGEAFYNRYDLDTIESAGIDLDAGGNFQILAGMANVFVDIPLAVVTPFVGAGIGYAEVKANDLEFGGVPLLDNSGSGLAYQLRAGVAFAIFPTTDLTLGYRYFVTDDLDMSNSTGGVEIDRLESHVFELGLRMSF